MISPELDQFCAGVHLEKSRQSNTNDCPWCNGNDYRNKKPELCLHREILDFTRWIVLTSEEKYLIATLTARMQTVLNIIWPGSKIIYTGASLSNTMIGSDLVEYTIINLPNDDSSAPQLEILQQALTTIKALRKSEIKDGILQGIENPNGLRISISLNNLDGIIQGQREKKAIELYPALYPLVILVKFFIFQSRLDEKFSHHLAFQISMSIIQSAPPQKKLDLGYLSSQFLKFFGTSFNYIACGISIRNGGFLFNRFDKSTKCSINWKSPNAICIEDPVHPGSFIGNDMNDIFGFRSRCYECFQRLKRVKNDCLDARGSGRDGCPQSLLISFLNRPDFIIRQRADKIRNYQAMIGNAITSFDLTEVDSNEGKNKRKGFDKNQSSNKSKSKDDHYRYDRNKNDHYTSRNDDRNNSSRNDRSYDRGKKFTKDSNKRDQYQRNFEKKKPYRR